MRQLVFDLGRPPSFDPDDFLESGSNVEALAMVTRWPDWPDRTLLLLGPSGSGKSHLGAIWAAQAGAQAFRPGDPLAIDTSRRPISFVEDCDRGTIPEVDLFHLLNLVREREGWALLSARSAPDLWNIKTPDLLSRLRLAPTLRIGSPDIPLVQAVIVKLFADRQIRIEEDVVVYAARHCEQSLEAVSAFVAAVDDESLAEGRRITRPLAARTLARLQDQSAASNDRDPGP